MQLSKYTMMFPLVSPEDTQTGEYALINGLYGAVDIVSPQEFALISDAMHTPSLLQELPKSRLETLTDRGHIVSSEAQESEDLRIISRIHTLLYGRGGVGLILAPTYNCNLRCSYCFERHRLARGLDWLERTMSDSLLESIFAQLKDYKSRGYSVKGCSLYGGEPLLARNKALIRKICEHCRQMDMSIGAVTNGCDLDQFLDLIDEYKISSIQVTVDGVGDVHDRRRPFAEGRGSYSRIMDNIALALSHGVKISLRVNVGRSNLSSITELPEEFKKRGFTESENFSYYFKAVDSPDDGMTDSEVMNEILKSGVNFEEAAELESDYSVAARNLAGWLDKNSWPALHTTYCGSENGMHVIGPDGLIYTCWNFVGMDEKATGFVEDGRFFYNFETAKWKTRTVDKMTPCRDCPILMLCGGGCARHGADDLTIGMCEGNREIFAEAAPRLLEKVRREGIEGLKKSRRHDPEMDKGDSPADKLAVKSKYADDESCMSLSFREILGTLTPEERNILMTTNSERTAFDILKAHNFA